MSVRNDLCVTCSKSVPSKLWGGSCEPGHQTVHLYPCIGCNRPCGMIMDDDYCGPEVLVCATCIEKIQRREMNIRPPA